MKLYKSFNELVGNTPLLMPENLVKENNLKANLYLKLELFNPAGSVKDRVAVSMIEAAEKSGELKSGATIIEPTSGNTGIGLAAVAAAKGYKIILTMPNSMSKERRDLLKAFGATLVLTDSKDGMKGAINKALELKSTIPDAFIPSQFDNKENPNAHYLTTGPEIWRDLDGKVDVFIAGVGTGGTISGVAKYLKEKNNNIKIIAVEPENSPFITKGKSGPHKIEGIGAGFIPKNLNLSLVDEVLCVSDNDSYFSANLLAKKEGLLVGASSGAALYAALIVAKREENIGKNIVALLPDTGTRYLSTEMFK